MSAEQMICPYCSGEVVFVDSSEVYRNGQSYGMIYLCRPCKAYVGVHKGTNKSLGRLASYKLRKAKMAAHAAFDLLWKKKQSVAPNTHKKRIKRGVCMYRNDAYSWLARELGIATQDCHIGMFDTEMCNKVVTAVNERSKK